MLIIMLEQVYQVTFIGYAFFEILKSVCGLLNRKLKQ